MNKEKFLRYFNVKKKNTCEDTEDRTVINVVTSVTKDIRRDKKNHTVYLSSIRSKFQKMQKEKLESTRQYLELPLLLKSFH